MVKIRKGTLTLPEHGTTPQDGRLMLVTPTDTSYFVETEVTVDKNSSAGLLLFDNEIAFAGLESDGNTFIVHKPEMEKETLENTIGKHFRVRFTVPVPASRISEVSNMKCCSEFSLSIA